MYVRSVLALALLAVAPACTTGGPPSAVTAGPPATVVAQALAVERYMLANGMTILTHEDHSIPMISFYLFYRVGSRNERPGITGVSHLFEHMMFNGSSKFKPKEFDLLLETAGSRGNAETTEDFTFYYETFPREALDLVLDLESDRMRSLLITPKNLEQERAIVKEERRRNIDNVPDARMYEELLAAAFVAHPYHWPVLGWMGDLDAIKLEEAQRYFDNFYGPSNATVILTGDFSTPELVKRVDAYFGKVAARGKVDTVVNSEPEQEGERRVTLVKEAALPAVLIGFKAPEASHKDASALEVLAAVLGRGDSSRIYRKLVYGQLATEASVEFLKLAHPSLVTFYAQAQEGKTAAGCEAAIYDVLRDITTNGVAPDELQKAKNMLRASLVRKLQTIDGKANLLGVYEVRYGDFGTLFSAIDNYDAVTNNDLKRVAAAYFAKRHRTVVTLVLPKDGKEEGDE